MNSNYQNEWDMLPDESGPHYRAFLTYCRQEEGRSTAKVGKTHNKSKAWADKLCAKYKWVERAAAYDRYVLAPAGSEMARVAQERRLAQAQALAALTTDLASKLAEMDFSELTSEQKVKLYLLAAKEERVVHGDAGDRTDHNVTGKPEASDFAQMLLAKASESMDGATEV